MPIVHRTNNRVLPANARAVDVAKSSIQRIAPTQARRYDAAFQVQGYHGILYTRLTSGEKCSCCDKESVAANQVRLDENGHADAGTINSLLTGQEFGLRPMGQVVATTKQAKASMREIAPIGYQRAGIAYPDRTKEPDRIYESDTGSNRSYVAGTATDNWSSTGHSQNERTIVSDGMGPGGPVSATEEVDEFPVSGVGYGMTDSSCPICFGSGFVGGYSVMRGWRKVLVPQNSNLLPGATMDFFSTPLSCDLGTEWPVNFPMGAVGVDSVKVYLDDQLVTDAILYVDGDRLLRETDIVGFCDGRQHLVRLELPEGRRFSHVELQINQSLDSANFELPRLSKNSNMDLLERTDPFQIILSPMVPFVKTNDIIIESVNGKVLQVKECTGWNDRHSNVLGWEASVRPVQPMETFFLLPRRTPRQRPHSVARVIDNNSGRRRT